MRPVSSRFLEALSKSHRLATRIEVLASNVVIATIDTALSGGVTLDRASQVRGRADLTIVDDGTLGLVPDAAADLLAPYGNEIRVSRGIQYPDDELELVSLATLGIQDTDVDSNASGTTIRVTGLDRAQRVIDARFEEPYEIDEGTNYADAIQDTLDAAIAGLTYSFPTITTTTPHLIAAEGDDRWAFVQSMGESLGMLLYFDGDGTCVLDPVAQPTGTADLELVEGATGVLVAAGRRWTREGAFNRVIATGENTGTDAAPVRGVATDDNPLSPTYYYGQFGKIPRFYSSQFLTTDAQALDAATAILARETGTSQSVTFGAVVNPAVEPNDIARITRTVAGIDENHVIDNLTIPLDAAGVMSGQTRAVQVTS